MLIYHITTQAAWLMAQTSGEYRAESLVTQGFIHFSTAEQVARVANAVYAGQTGLVLLVVDLARLTAVLRSEPADVTIPVEHGTGELFPHLYGALNLEAVVAVVDFAAGADGMFVFIPPESQT